MSSVEVRAIHEEMEEKKKKLNLERLNLQPPVPLRFLHKRNFKACGKLVRAACVVLTFVFVAIFIPIFPAKAERKGTENKGNYY
jgi:hypothetical protein